MLNAIIGFSIRNKLIIGLFVIFLAGFGIYETTKLPIDAVPDITNNQVQVMTVAPSYGATDIERLVTFPIEQACSNINGITEIRSFSRFGLSLVTIVFTDQTNVYWARQQVAERLQKVQAIIPPGIGIPELGPISTGLGEIYQYVVRPKKGYENKYDATELRTIQDWLVRRQLLGVKGVAEVSSFGGKLKQYEVAVIPGKLKAFNISLLDIYNALEKNNQNTGGAYIEKSKTALYIRSEGLINTKEDIQNISVKTLDNGTPLYIRDVADVQTGHATRYGALTYNDKGEVSGAVVMMLKGANSSEVIKNIKARIEQIQQNLPEGVVIEAFLDRSKMVSHAISTVQKNLLEGALIVVFILVLFLGNIRAGLLVASVIPLSMLFAIILMNAFGVSGNLMSLGALDFGLIVDGAVIIVEAVMHQLTHSKKFQQLGKLNQQQMDEEVGYSAKKMMNSAVFGQIIILIVYLPIFTLQGIEGKMFKPMAQTVAFALIGAFILSLTYIPMMASIFLGKKLKHKPNFSDKWLFKLERVYQLALSKLLNFPKMIIVTVLLLFSIAMFILSRLGGEFIPSLEEGDFAVDTRVLTGSSLHETVERTQKAARVLKERFPEVEKVVSKIGSGEVPTDPMPMEASDMMVILKEKKDWVSAKTFDELANKMSVALQDVPGITTGFQYPVQMRFNELMTGARQDVVCKIFGENLDTLAHYAEILGRLAGQVKGSLDMYIEPITGIPQVVVEYNRNAISQYGLSIEDVNRVLHISFAGQSAGTVFEGEKRFDLVLRLDTGQRKNLEDVQNLLVPVPNGSQIPLYLLANVSIKDGPNQVQREDTRRRIVVGFNVRGRDVESVVKDVQQKFKSEVKLPPGYTVTYGGAFENLKHAKDRLAIAVPVSLLLIFILLFFAFNSVKHGLLIYTAIPLSAIGGIYFLALRGMPFSISAGIGFIALFGVSVLNGIVLIAEFNRLKAEGMHDLRRIVLMGTKVRLRPVLMTALVASLGFLPMALSNGAGAEVQRPLATVVIGGLLLATFLTLFVLPILYIIFETSGKSKPMVKNPVILMILFCICPFLSNAQQSIDHNAAIDTALKNNMSVKNEKLKSDYRKHLIGSSADIPHAGMLFEAGQINAVYHDTRVGFSQSFSFPTVYKRRKNMLQEEWKSSVLSVALKEAEIRRDVSFLYYHILVLKGKEKLLRRSDSLFADFQARSQLRFEKGETNTLEKSTADIQRGQIKLQLASLLHDLDLAKLQFRLLLNASQAYEPVSSSIKMQVSELPDTNAVNNHVLLQQLEQEKVIATADMDVQKSRLLPDLGLGYMNMSARGIGPDDKFYSASDRFHAAQFSIGIPIFNAAAKSRIRASKINMLLAEGQYEQSKKQLMNDFQSVNLQYTLAADQLTYYEQSGLSNARLIADAAGKQLRAGEINYLQWVLLVGQSVDIESAYLDAVQQYNETVIRMNYLTFKQ